MGALLPDASTIVFFTGAGDLVVGNIANLASFSPVAAGVSLATPFSARAPDFVSYRWTGSKLHGGYVFFLLATRAGALADGIVTDAEFLGIATAPFSFM